MSRPPPRITLRDVAAAAGVSNATVSLALSKHPRISVATRERITRLAVEMGYRPDPVARRLSSRKAEQGKGRFMETIGVIYSEWSEPELKMPRELAPWQPAIDERAAEHGCKINRFPWPKNKQGWQRLDSILKARGIRGVLLEAKNTLVEDWPLEWERLAVVAISASTHSRFVHNAVSSMLEVTYHADQHLRQLGYNRPGVYAALFDPAHIPMAMSGLGVSKEHWDIGRFLFNGARQDAVDLRQWLQSYQIDVVIGQGGDWCVRHLRSLGVRVPEDVAYCGLDIFPIDKEASGAVVAREARNRLAVDLLVSALFRHEFGPPVDPVCLQLAPGWQPGHTAPPRHLSQ